MNWKSLGKAIAHAAFGGFVAGLSTYAGGPINFKNVLFAGLGSAFTSVISFFSQPK